MNCCRPNIQAHTDSNPLLMKGKNKLRTLSFGWIADVQIFTFCSEVNPVGEGMEWWPVEMHKKEGKDRTCITHLQKEGVEGNLWGKWSSLSSGTVCRGIFPSELHRLRIHFTYSKSALNWVWTSLPWLPIQTVIRLDVSTSCIRSWMPAKDE